MRAAAILPVKRFGAAKQRLSDAMEPADRAALSEAMAGDVLAALRRSKLIERVIVVSGEPRMAALAGGLDLVLLDDPTDSGHSAAAAIGAREAVAGGAESVALLPGDCPLLDPLELDAALAALAERSIAVVPDRHGSGTNGLLLRPPDLIEPAFGPDSRERHLRLAEEAGASGVVVEMPSLALDLDTGGDLEQLLLELEAGALEGSATARALRGNAALPIAGGG
jgi:2-phospho-L-lactate guanylyltransferase